MPLPNFIIIGSGRSGTTSLYHYLKQHSDIYMSPVKEPNFFGFDFENTVKVPPELEPAYRLAVKTIDDYLALFEGVNHESAIGEASTQYLLFPGTAERIRHRIPEARLIVTLRHPAERIYSSYLLRRMSGREPCGKFEDALQAGRHLMKGKYATLLAPFYENFRRERIHVLLFDDLVSRPMDTVKSIYAFLGVDASFNPDVGERHSESRVFGSELARKALYDPWIVKTALRLALPKSVRSALRANVMNWSSSAAPPLSPQTRLDLVDYYRYEIAQLQDMIGRDLSHWLR